MEIKSKKFINEGFNSKAYVINGEYILLEGVNHESYNNYLKYAESINVLRNIKSVQIPNIVRIISPTNDYPNGALVYKMIKGHTFRQENISKINLDNIAETLADFLNELHSISIPFDKDIFVKNEILTAKSSVSLLKRYFDEKDYNEIQVWLRKYESYLLNFDGYSFIHGDLWYENFILDDENALTGIVDFECAGMGDPASDFASLYYLGSSFVDKVLEHYNFVDINLKRRIPILIKAREIANFENILNNYPEEVEEQVAKIRSVLLFS